MALIPARWRASTPAELNDAFFPDGSHHVLAVVNIGKPGQGAWMDRLPRLDFDEVVSTL